MWSRFYQIKGLAYGRYKLNYRNIGWVFVWCEHNRVLFLMQCDYCHFVNYVCLILVTKMRMTKNISHSPSPTDWCPLDNGAWWHCKLSRPGTNVERLSLDHRSECDGYSKVKQNHDIQMCWFTLFETQKKINPVSNISHHVHWRISIWWWSSFGLWVQCS